MTWAKLPFWWPLFTPPEIHLFIHVKPYTLLAALWAAQAYTREPAQNEDQTPDRVTLATYLTVLWMSGLVKASETRKTSIDRLFSDGDRSDLFRFLSKCSEIIDPRVRKAVSHYGHVPLMYALSDGTQHYPGTDTLWADKGNTFYAWLCDKRGYFNEYNLNPESKGDLLEVCALIYTTCTQSSI